MKALPFVPVLLTFTFEAALVMSFVWTIFLVCITLIKTKYKTVYRITVYGTLALFILHVGFLAFGIDSIVHSENYEKNYFLVQKIETIVIAVTFLGFILGFIMSIINMVTKTEIKKYLSVLMAVVMCLGALIHLIALTVDFA